MTDAEYRRAKRKVTVPLFFKRKVFMVCMLLACSGILAVVTTYAWFILSTAPEISGVTMTAGANGSLEVVLLDNTTFNSPDEKISVSEDGADSLYGEDGTTKLTGFDAIRKANARWGNLVDLSAEEYGLGKIKLYPSVLNTANGSIPRGEGILSIPRYGLDGRVVKVSSDTVSSFYDGKAGSFSVDIERAKYNGVLAIGAGNSGTSQIGKEDAFYGYVVDLAFRTNVPADLQLQTEAVDRVYSQDGMESGGTGTKGHGSGVICKESDGIMSLLKTVRVVFFDPDNGEVYGTAVLGTAKAEGGEISAPLAMQDDKKKIVALNTAAEAKKVSVLIYLDGTGNTGMGANEATELKLYLQFSSSANDSLNPMVDNELKNAKET